MARPFPCSLCDCGKLVQIAVSSGDIYVRVQVVFAALSWPSSAPLVVAVVGVSSGARKVSEGMVELLLAHPTTTPKGSDMSPVAE